MGQPLTQRHRELISGSIAPLARRKRRKAQPHRQVRPVRIDRIDQVDLPLAAPVLELLFAQDGWFHFAEQFVMDQPVDSVTIRETRRQTATMLRNSADKVRRYTNIDRAISPARKDMDTRLTLFPHGPETGAKWTLNQVQGDDGESVVLQTRHAELVSAFIVPQAPHA
jgi:hypothetical protein